MRLCRSILYVPRRSFMASTRNYRHAVSALNSLQSNAAVLAKQQAMGGRDITRSVPHMEDYLKRIGVEISDLEKINAIHVAGSKGKGSTCAMVEAILRGKGFKTGLYTSPHLMQVRERIRINSEPLAHDLFCKYFWVCWDMLHEHPTHLDDCEPLPPYFRFLTLVSLKAFIEEKVDVAIMEVGLGGRYDATNVLRKPVVCGISHLGLEHTRILGNTVGEIAYHKAGIFKPGVQAFTSPQVSEAMDSLMACSKEVQMPLASIPDLDSYKNLNDLHLGIGGDHQRWNASLALQLSKYWMDHQRSEPTTVGEGQQAPGFELDGVVVDSLKNCRWPGRSHVIKRDSVTYYLDGAHTIDSCTACAKWFGENQENSADRLSVLLFNCTGSRNEEQLLAPYAELGFDHAYFCPNTAFEGTSSEKSSDQANLMVDHALDDKITATNEAAWQTAAAHKCPTEKFKTVQATLQRIQQLSEESGKEVNVLVTGSLLLVGACMTALHCEVQ